MAASPLEGINTVPILAVCSPGGDAPAYSAPLPCVSSINPERPVGYMRCLERTGGRRDTRLGVNRVVMAMVIHARARRRYASATGER